MGKRSAPEVCLRSSHKNQIGNLTTYKNILLPQQAYLTDRMFLTQGSGSVAPWSLAIGKHIVTMAVQSEDGELTRGEFVVDVPAWPGQISIRLA
jgi:hypothetical protein